MQGNRIQDATHLVLGPRYHIRSGSLRVQYPHYPEILHVLCSTFRLTIIPFYGTPRGYATIRS